MGGRRPRLGPSKDINAMLNFYGKTFSSRLLIGSALYPSPAIMQAAIRASGAAIVTVSLRREAAGGQTGDAVWALVPGVGGPLRPHNARLPRGRGALPSPKTAPRR